MSAKGQTHKTASRKAERWHGLRRTAAPENHSPRFLGERAAVKAAGSIDKRRVSCVRRS